MKCDTELPYLVTLQLLALGNNGNHFKVLVFCCSCCLFVFIISKLEMQKQGDLFLEDASIIRWFTEIFPSAGIKGREGIAK